MSAPGTASRPTNAREPQTIFWRPLETENDSKQSWRHLYRFRSPYRFEVDIVDNLLLAHETRKIPLNDPDALGSIEVALFYKRSPHYENPEAPDPEREAVLVQRVVVEH